MDLRLLFQDEAMLATLASSREFQERYGADVSDHRELAREVLRQTLALADRVRAVPPWGGYLCVEEATGRVVGTGGFTGNPDPEGAVEIAYFTFPTDEGRGIATAAAGRLVEIAREHRGAVWAVAHTLPEEGASTRILRKLGFEHVGEVEHPEDGPVWRWRLALRD